jgi:hypothetical protein
MVGTVISLCYRYEVDSQPVDTKNIFFETESNQSFLSSNFLAHTSHAENVVTAGSPSASSSIKNPFQGFSFLIKGVEQFFGQIFPSNSYYSQNLFVGCSHTDLIFPFHYFW